MSIQISKEAQKLKELWEETIKASHHNFEMYGELGTALIRRIKDPEAKAFVNQARTELLEANRRMIEVMQALSSAEYRLFHYDKQKLTDEDKRVWMHNDKGHDVLLYPSQLEHYDKQGYKIGRARNDENNT